MVCTEYIPLCSELVEGWETWGPARHTLQPLLECKALWVTEMLTYGFGLGKLYQAPLSFPLNILCCRKSKYGL